MKSQSPWTSSSWVNRIESTSNTTASTILHTSWILQSSELSPRQNHIRLGWMTCPAPSTTQLGINALPRHIEGSQRSTSTTSTITMEHWHLYTFCLMLSLAVCRFTTQNSKVCGPSELLKNWKRFAALSI